MLQQGKNTVKYYIQVSLLELSVYKKEEVKTFKNRTRI